MRRFLLGVFALSVLFLASCKNDVPDIGSSIQPGSDLIEFAADTFHLATDTMLINSIYTLPDSFLLGYFHNEKYGSTQAEIFAQLKAPIGFVFRKGVKMDSAAIVFSYYSWFGDGNSPMRINIYEMKGKPFTFSGLYPSSIDPSEYADFTKPLASQVILPKDTMRGDSTQVFFKLSKEFVQRFLPDTAKNTTYASDANFFNFFKGIYINSDFGTSALLAIRNIRLNYYYSYKVKTADSTYTISQVLSFPANNEVRQVNRILHPNRKEMLAPEAGLTYISSPANIFTRVRIPIERIAARINDSIPNANIVINTANIKMEIANRDNSKYGIPLPRYAMLIREKTFRSMQKNKIPTSLTDTTAIYAELDSAKHYVFDLRRLLATELQLAKKKGQAPSQSLDMVLMPFTPVHSKVSGSRENIAWGKHMIPMSAATIRSGANTESPMRIKVVYSGF